MRETAENHYHGINKYNCAQAIAATFDPENSSLIEQLQKAGGGRADGNVCGALHAALIVEKDESKQTIIRKEFESAAGSVQCRTIRSSGQLSCKGCVGTAADLLVKVRAESN